MWHQVAVRERWNFAPEGNELRRDSGDAAAPQAPQAPQAAAKATREGTRPDAADCKVSATFPGKQGTTRIGYTRVSAAKHRLHLQCDALDARGCKKILDQKTSGANTRLPKWNNLLGHATRAGAPSYGSLIDPVVRCAISAIRSRVLRLAPSAFAPRANPSTQRRPPASRRFASSPHWPRVKPASCAREHPPDWKPRAMPAPGWDGLARPDTTDWTWGTRMAPPTLSQREVMHQVGLHSVTSTGISRANRPLSRTALRLKGRSCPSRPTGGSRHSLPGRGVLQSAVPTSAHRPHGAHGRRTEETPNHASPTKEREVADVPAQLGCQACFVVGSTVAASPKLPVAKELVCSRGAN